MCVSTCHAPLATRAPRTCSLKLPTMGMSSSDLCKPVMQTAADDFDIDRRELAALGVVLRRLTDADARLMTL